MNTILRTTIASAAIAASLMSATTANAAIFELTVTDYTTQSGDTLTGSIFYNDNGQSNVGNTQLFYNPNFTWTPSGGSAVNLSFVQQYPGFASGNFDVRIQNDGTPNPTSSVIFDFFPNVSSPNNVFNPVAGTSVLDVATFGTGPALTDFSVAAVSAVPEPSTYAMMAIGLLGVAGMSRRNKKQAK